MPIVMYWSVTQVWNSLCLDWKHNYYAPEYDLIHALSKKKRLMQHMLSKLLKLKSSNQWGRIIELNE